MKKHKVYKWTNLIIGACYVGKTCRTLEERAGQNMKAYRNCSKFWEAIQHYGSHCWRSEILWEGLTAEEATIYEQVEIQDNDALYPYGYNIEIGNEAPRSDETRRKQSEARKNLSDEARENLSESKSGENHHFYGKTLSREHREALSESLKHSPRAIEHRKNLAERPVSEATREKQSESHTGQKRTPEAKAKMREKAKEREARKKAEGYTVSDETRKRNSIASRKVWASKNPPKYAGRDVFFSLPLDMPIAEKRNLLLEKFGNDVHEATIYRWIREWHTELTGSPPSRDMWNKGVKIGKPAHNRKPEYESAREIFLSLPSDMPLSEKRKILHERFPQILKSRCNKWICRWLSELDV